MKKNKTDSGRQHARTSVRSNLRMKHNHLGELVVVTENISDGGVFVELLMNEKPQVGDLVSIQLQDLPIIAPVIPAKVVRVDKNGLALEFVAEAKKD